MPPDTRAFWANRRKIAYICLFAIIYFGHAIILGDIDAAKADVLKWVVGALALPIVAYVYCATMEDLEKLKPP